MLTGHQSLDPVTGQRLFQAMSTQDAEFPAAVSALIAYAREHGASKVEALDVALKGTPLHGALLRVIQAWYSGVIEPGSNATVYACQGALMYRVPADGVVIPTYAHNGPNCWTAEPPPVDRLLVF